MYYDLGYISATKVNETITNYTITALHPYLSYTFTAYIRDLFNNTKDQIYVQFCKLIVIYNGS